MNEEISTIFLSHVKKIFSNEKYLTIFKDFILKILVGNTIKFIIVKICKNQYA